MRKLLPNIVLFLVGAFMFFVYPGLDLVKQSDTSNTLSILWYLINKPLVHWTGAILCVFGALNILTMLLKEKNNYRVHIVAEEGVLQDLRKQYESALLKNKFKVTFSKVLLDYHLFETHVLIVWATTKEQAQNYRLIACTPPTLWIDAGKLLDVPKDVTLLKQDLIAPELIVEILRIIRAKCI